MPALYESYDVVGRISEENAKKFGMTEDVKIIAGAGDNAAAAIGTGTVGGARCNISLGTSGTVFISNDRFEVDPNNALHSFDHADGKYHLMGCILSAASCNKWWMENILETENYAEEQKKINRLGENSVYFLPYLMGERSPHNDSNARGTFVGMTMDSKREDMTLAILEGVAYAIRDCVEVARNLDISIKSATICGGGAKSDLWCKIIANVLNIEIKRLETEEGPGYGAAILAAVGCGEYENVEIAALKLSKEKIVIKPEKELAESMIRNIRNSGNFILK